MTQLEYVANLFSDDKEISQAANKYFLNLRDPSPFQGQDVLDLLVSHLDLHDSVEHQQLAVLALRSIKNYSAVPFLIKFLQESNDDILYHLPHTLATFGGEIVVTALISKLQTTTSESLQRQLIQALGTLGDSRAEESILPFLSKDSPSFFRSAVISALGSCGTKKSADNILSIFHDSTDQNYELSSLCSALHDLQNRNFIPISEDLFTTDVFFPLEALALREQIQNHNLELIPVYLNHFTDIGFLIENNFCPCCDGNTTQQSIAFQVGTDALPSLVGFFEDPSGSEPGKIEALTILMMIHSDISFQFFLKLFSNDDAPESFRKMAARALSRYPQEDVITILLDSYPQVSPALQVDILWAFKELKSPQILPILINYLLDDCFSERLPGTYFYYDNYDILDRGTQILPIKYDHERWNVIDLVIRVLKEIGPHTIPEIISFLSTNIAVIKEDVLLGLLWVLFQSHANKDDINQIKPILHKIVDNPQSHYHIALANYLLNL